MHATPLSLITALLLSLPVSVSSDVTDPTRPLFSKMKKPPATKTTPVRITTVEKPAAKPEVYVLTSTLVSRQRTIAVINDRVVAVGDNVGRATVVEITPARVRLRSGTKEITIALAAAGIKKSWKSGGNDRNEEMQ